jgi:hypothetical protein
MWAFHARVNLCESRSEARSGVQSDLEADRQVANTLAELIIGGTLASTEIIDGTAGTAADTPDDVEKFCGVTTGPFTNPFYRRHARGRFLVRNRPLTLVAGAGFEPATSGL